MHGNPTRGGKRDAIIAAAVQVFSDKGYHHARMEEIALRAGIGKGTVYEYFDSKLHLFQAVMENSVELYYESVAPISGDSLTFTERMCRLIEGHVRFCQENREWTRIVFWDTDIFDQELKEWTFAMRKEKERRMQDIIEEAIARGELRQVDSHLLTLMVAGVLGSLWGPITLDGWSVDARELAENTVDIIMNGIIALAE